jgi:hypothetical protein
MTRVRHCEKRSDDAISPLILEPAMEDEGFVDDDFIEETAREYIALHSFNAVALLRERARLAEAAGDFLLAETWREIVDAAEEMLGAGFMGEIG